MQAVLLFLGGSGAQPGMPTAELPFDQNNRVNHILTLEEQFYNNLYCIFMLAFVNWFLQSLGHGRYWKASKSFTKNSFLGQVP